MTQKLYYEDGFLIANKAKIVKICDCGVILDKTVAFAEGGGQIGDIGYIEILKNGEKFNFFNTTKIGGEKLQDENFATILVNSDILHYIDSQNLSNFCIGDEVIVKIDANHRAKTTSLHTAIHLALMALNELRPNIKDKIYGCKITTQDARLDFKVDEKFSQIEIDKINTLVKKYICDELEIKTYPSENEKEIIYWECNGYKIHRTHLNNTKFLQIPTIKRKNIGKGVDRIKLEIENFTPPLHLYYG